HLLPDPLRLRQHDLDRLLLGHKNLGVSQLFFSEIALQLTVPYPFRPGRDGQEAAGKNRRNEAMEEAHVGEHPRSFSLAFSLFITAAMASSDGSTGHHFVACWVTPPRRCQRCLFSTRLTFVTSSARLTTKDILARSLLSKSSRSNAPNPRLPTSISVQTRVRRIRAVAGAAVHHLHPAADRVQPLQVSGETDHADRPEAVRRQGARLLRA